MLNRAIVGSTYTAQRVSWPNQDFSGASLSGVLIDDEGTESDITGTLTPVDGETGLFDWVYSAADVTTAGYYFVQFTADYGAEGLQKTLRTTWKVED